VRAGEGRGKRKVGESRHLFLILYGGGIKERIKETKVRAYSTAASRRKDPSIAKKAGVEHQLKEGKKGVGSALRAAFGEGEKKEKESTTPTVDVRRDGGREKGQCALSTESCFEKGKRPA